MIKDVVEFYDKQKANNYPLKEHPLTKSDEYTKEAYLKMMCAVLQYEAHPREAQIMFLQRLIKGIELENTVEKYIRSSLEINIEFAEEFVRLFSQNSLKYNFLVDVLVMLFCDGNYSDKQIKFVAKLCEVLLIPKNLVEFLVKLTVCILEQNNESYQEIITVTPHSIDMSIFLTYTKECVVGYIINSPDKIYLYAKETTEYIFGREKITIEGKTEIIFENLIVDLSNCELIFYKNEDITFKNCNFLRGSNCIKLNECKNLNIIDCTFENFTSRVFDISLIDNLKIKGSLFKNCSSCKNDNTIFHLDSIKTLSIKYCKFIKCYSQRGNGVIMSINGHSCFSSSIEIEYCKFYDCKVITYRDNSGYLFYGFHPRKQNLSTNEFSNCCSSIIT